MILQAASQQQTFNQIPTQSFNSIFGGIFGKKKPEQEQQAPVEKKTEEKKPEKGQANEPTKYHKETVKASNEEEEDIKS